MGSVTGWLERLKGGDLGAAQPLDERYRRRVVALARKLLRGAQLPLADEEDVAQDVLGSLFKGVARNQFNNLGDRDGLWALLAHITRWKVAHAVRDENAQKRGGGARGATNSAEDPDGPPDKKMSEREWEVRQAQVLAQLTRYLKDEKLISIVLQRMEGYTEKEIAERQGCSPRTIGRKLKLICKKWKREASRE
jgi:RNA polymerase sigma factor (sigma-70 family)